MSDVDLPSLIAALRGVCETFGAAAATASYVSPLQGRVVTLQVTAGGVVTLEDDNGHLVAVPRGMGE